MLRDITHTQPSHRKLTNWSESERKNRKEEPRQRKPSGKGGEEESGGVKIKLPEKLTYLSY